MTGAFIGVAVAGVMALLWLTVAVARKSRRTHGSFVDTHVSAALTSFAEQSLELQSVEQILEFAADAAREVLESKKVVVFERGDDDSSWEVRVAGSPERSRVSNTLSGVFGWLRHNHSAIVEADLGESRFGAMRRLIQQIFAQHELDTLIPLVERGRVLAAIGVRMGRKLAKNDRDALRLFRLGTTAACANVRLHREAAHLFSLDKEVDLASAVDLSLAPPQSSGQVGVSAWAGHHEIAGRAGSDFYAAYPLDEQRLIILIGDAVGVELAGAMVAAVIMSCADSLMHEDSGTMTPARLLTALNHALYQPRRPTQASCFAMLVNPLDRSLSYANAGHAIPYRLQYSQSGSRLGALPGTGPLLGDSDKTVYGETKTYLSGDDAFVLFTNGVLRVRDEDRKDFGDRSVQRLLKAQSVNSPEVIRDALVTAVKKHRGKRKLVDDQALVVVSSRFVV